MIYITRHKYNILYASKDREVSMQLTDLFWKYSKFQNSVLCRFLVLEMQKRSFERRKTVRDVITTNFERAKLLF